MKVLFVGDHDWANICNRTARALQSVGVDARVWTRFAHPFGYKEDVVGEAWPELEKWADENIDWIFTTGDGSLVSYTVPANVRNFGVCHAGSAFRDDPKKYNMLDFACKAKLRFVGADSLRLADDRVPTFPYWTVAEEWKSLDDLLSRPIKVAHCPSNRGTKGTETIIEACRKANVELTLVEGTKHHEVIEVLKNTQILIDQINPEVGGFGSIAVEAAALGCAVISDLRNVPFKETWSPPFWTASDVTGLETVLDHWRMKSGRFTNDSYQWAQQHASPSAVGQQWKSLLEKYGE